MISKGVGDIRGMRSVNTRPGPVRETDALRRLYLLACEKTNLEKRKRLGERQIRQATKRLAEIKMQMMKLKGGMKKYEGGNLSEVVAVANPGEGAKRSSLSY